MYFRAQGKIPLKQYGGRKKERDTELKQNVKQTKKQTHTNLEQNVGNHSIKNAKSLFLSTFSSHISIPVQNIVWKVFSEAPILLCYLVLSWLNQFCSILPDCLPFSAMNYIKISCKLWFIHLPLYIHFYFFFLNVIYPNFFNSEVHKTRRKTNVEFCIIFHFFICITAL